MSNAPHDRTSAHQRPDDAALAPRAGAGPEARGESASAARPLGEERTDGAVTASSAAHGTAATGTAAPGTTARGTGTRAQPGTGAAPGVDSAEPTTGRTAPVDPALDAPAKRGVSGTVWAALILGVIVLILLLVFIIQNNVSAHFEYLAWQFNLPLGVAMLFSAIAGALIMALVGSVRIFTLGHRMRKLEKERQRIRTALSD
ncbi:LapA family protein [Kocuria varians]|uniref:LapA family protein n=1 Tax=Kocuria varians TaxID=1272 RepID=UPI000838FACF|nr:LapA family protein [Kocuria varians]